MAAALEKQSSCRMETSACAAIYVAKSTNAFDNGVLMTFFSFPLANLENGLNHFCIE
jgi:hypothetical protein